MALVPCSNTGFSSSSSGLTRRSPHSTLCSFLKPQGLDQVVRSGSHGRLSDPTASTATKARAETREESDATEEASRSAAQQKQSVLEALDFSAVRSVEDAKLLEDARSVTGMGEQMSREQYAALRRKIGGTYRDFFKDSIEVDGDYVDEGWVDKTCRFCKKDTASEPRTVDKYGRYAHVACLEKSKSGNFFTRLFGM